MFFPSPRSAQEKQRSQSTTRPQLPRKNPEATMDDARKIKLTAVADSEIEIDEEGNVVDPQ